MEYFNLQIASLTLGSLGFALIGLWSARNGRARLLLLGLFSALLGIIFSASASLMGRAKPIEFGWLQPQAEAANIISGHLLEGRGIYLTINWDGEEPLLYVMPWDQKTAQQLLEALAEAEQNGTQAKMKMPVGKTQISQNDEAPFYAPPQPQPAEKALPEEGIRLGYAG